MTVHWLSTWLTESWDSIWWLKQNSKQIMKPWTKSKSSLIIIIRFWLTVETIILLHWIIMNIINNSERKKNKSKFNQWTWLSWLSWWSQDGRLNVLISWKGKNFFFYRILMTDYRWFLNPIHIQYMRIFFSSFSP